MFEAEICGMFCPTYCTTCDAYFDGKEQGAECCGNSTIRTCALCRYSCTTVTLLLLTTYILYGNM